MTSAVNSEPRQDTPELQTDQSQIKLVLHKFQPAAQSKTPALSAELEMPSSDAPNTMSNDSILIEQIVTPEDIIEAFNPICNTFGRQTQDGFFMAMNPGWETPEGQARGASLMVDRWRATTKNQQGRPNAIFLKATVPSESESNKIVGTAIWLQASNVPGHGDPPVQDLSKAMNLDNLYPGNAAEQRYLCQVDYSLHRQRIELVKKKVDSSPPSVMVLDLCVVDPAYQGRGIARRLVQWGLDEANARGGLECITEASIMGRWVYQKMGFRQEGPDIEFVVDEEFADRSRPPNIFMRTGID